jgi:hypothetical protein
MTAITKSTVRPILLGAAAFLTGTVLLSTAGQAGNTGKPIGTTTGVEVQTGVNLRLAPLKCERTSGQDFPCARITNVSGAPIKKGKVIAYKFSSGLHDQLTLMADLPNNDSVVTLTATDPGYTCTATLL